LKAFSKFENISEATEAASLLIDSKASKGLRKFLRVNCENETLGVADSKLGNIIKDKLVCYFSYFYNVLIIVLFMLLFIK
jgi:nucleolar protein 58